jgi:hypothetical protein
MKVKTALKQSVAGAKFAALVLIIASGLTLTWPNGYTLALLAFAGIYFVGDAINVVRIRRRASEKPGFLDEELK